MSKICVVFILCIQFCTNCMVAYFTRVCTAYKEIIFVSSAWCDFLFVYMCFVNNIIQLL